MFSTIWQLTCLFDALCLLDGFVLDWSECYVGHSANALNLLLCFSQDFSILFLKLLMFRAWMACSDRLFHVATACSEKLAQACFLASGLYTFSEWPLAWFTVVFLKSFFKGRFSILAFILNIWMASPFLHLFDRLGSSRVFRWSLYGFPLRHGIIMVALQRTFSMACSPKCRMAPRLCFHTWWWAGLEFCTAGWVSSFWSTWRSMDQRQYPISFVGCCVGLEVNLSLLSMMMPRSFSLSLTGIVCVFAQLVQIIRWERQLSFSLPIHITLYFMMLSLMPRFERSEVKMLMPFCRASMLSWLLYLLYIFLLSA